MGSMDELTPATCAFWAKSATDEAGGMHSSLVTHLLDTADVADLLWDRWMSARMRASLALGITGASEDDEIARRIIRFLALIHDIGKATPAFQCKVPDLAEAVRECGLAVPAKAYKALPHAVMGEAIFEEWACARGWKERPDAQTYGCVIGSHHGAAPNLSDIKRAKLNIDPEYEMGDELWRGVQSDLLDWAWSQCIPVSLEDRLTLTPLSQPAAMLVTGLIIMADWIASNQKLFPPDGGSPRAVRRDDRALVAWDALELPSCTMPHVYAHDDGELFRLSFPGLPAGAKPYPLQQEVMRIARDARDAGLVIIEEQTGSGKTEAALLFAEAVGAERKLGGVAFFQPTMATSNAAFGRIMPWLSHLEKVAGDDHKASVSLAHSKAALNGAYREISGWGSRAARGVNDAEAPSLVAPQWLEGSKKRLLASYVVATVDQLLMAALKAKHVQLRHLGLADKVVIIDEVHAYDAYMNVYLDRVLEWLGSYGVPVVLLSATLPSQRREALIKAYRGRRHKSKLAQTTTPCPDDPDRTFPLVSVYRDGKIDQLELLVCKGSNRELAIDVKILEEGQEPLLNLLRKKIGNEGCACVICNTVHRAQETYDLLSEELDANVMLAHSRFLACDRAERDAELLRLLGPDRTQRPRSLVVVGTQVVEQSLDIDFDLMVSDVAPIDLLVQRAGRLHRHNVPPTTRSTPLRKPQLYVRGIEKWAEGVPVFSRGITAVYEEYLLLATLSALGLKEGGASVSLSIPSEVPALVEHVYDDAPEALETFPAEWRERAAKARSTLNARREKKQGSARAYLFKTPLPPSATRRSLLGSFDAALRGTDEQRARAQVRDTEDGIEVVVVQASDGEFCVPQGACLPAELIQQRGASLGDGSTAPDFQAAQAAALCTVCLPMQLTRGHMDTLIDVLESQFDLSGWQESSWLRGALPLVMDERMHKELELDERRFGLWYSSEEGLRVKEVTKDE